MSETYSGAYSYDGAGHSADPSGVFIGRLADDPFEADPSGVWPDVALGQADEDTTPDLSRLLKSQARLALTLQRRVETSPNMEVKELKDIATACSSLVNGVHRTGELLRTLETYKLFHSVVLSFLSERSDLLGEDLLAELKSVADKMSATNKMGGLL
jgi:hypothetical protein